MFDDLFDFNNNDEELNANYQEEDEELWDTGNVWSTGKLPKEVWTTN